MNALAKSLGWLSSCGRKAAWSVLGSQLWIAGSSAHGQSVTSSPYAPSPIIAGIAFDIASLQRAAPGSDLWPIAWSDDGELYASWGDGGGFGGTDSDGRVAVGIGRITGSGERWAGFNILGGKNPITAT